MRRTPVFLAVLLLVTLLAPPAATAKPHHHHGARFPAVIDLPDGFAPEGITSGRGTTVYAGSLAGGGIWRGDVRTGEGTLLAEGVDERVAVGLDYDRRRDVLWVAGGGTGEVRAHDARTGEVLATYTVDAPTGFLNDVVVTRDAVYVTDSNIEQLVVVPLSGGRGLPDEDAARVQRLSGDLEYVEGFNANGIVEAGRYLVVVQSATGLLFRVDPVTGTTERIDIGGATVTAGDGLELRGRTLYVVRNQLNEVAVVRLHGTLTEGRLVDTLTAESFDIPTTITVAAGRLWAVNARFGTPVTPDTEYWISQVPRR